METPNMHILKLFVVLNELLVGKSLNYKWYHNSDTNHKCKKLSRISEQVPHYEDAVGTMSKLCEHARVNKRLSIKDTRQQE